MTQKTELRERVEARRHQLEARLHELKADAQSDSREAIERIEAELQEARATLKGGWDELTEDAAARINDWLAKDDV